MSGGASIGVIGVVLSTAALAMVILIYARPEIIGISEPEAEKATVEPEGATSERGNGGDQWNKMSKEQQMKMVQMMGEQGKGREGGQSKHVYSFAYENFERPYNFLDNEGKLAGVMQDLVVEACKRAGQQCVHMYMGKSGGPCWNADLERGIGLDRMYYDACVTWSISKKRANVYQFTKPLMANIFNSIYASDSSKTQAMMTTEKFGFVDAWLGTPECVYQELKERIPEENQVVFKDLESVTTKLKSGEISFAILPSGTDGFPVLANQLTCGRLGGYSIMMRFDSHLPVWFNKAFKEMTDDGTYKDICEAAEDKYGAAAECL